MPSMSVNGRLRKLERAIGLEEHHADRAAVRAAILDLLANPHAVEALRSAAADEDCDLSEQSQINTNTLRCRSKMGPSEGVPGAGPEGTIATVLYTYG
jgi:hypothetical protein